MAKLFLLAALLFAPLARSMPPGIPMGVAVTPASASILHVVGNYNTSAPAQVSITPMQPGDVIMLFAHQVAITGQDITATGNTVTQLGSAEEQGGYFTAQAVIELAASGETTVSAGADGIIIAVEISGVDGAPLASITGGRTAGTTTITGSSSPWTLSGESTDISTVPALALAFGVNSQANNDFSAPGTGYSVLDVTWQTAPPTGMAMLESMELQAAATVAGTFAIAGSTAYYDSNGVACAVLAESDRP